MTGSLQEKNGRFHMVISYTDESGKRKNKWISTGLEIKGNKKKAHQMLNQWLNEHKNYDMASSELLFTAYFEDWLKKVKTDLQPSTLRGYKGKYKNHIGPYFNTHKKKLSELKVRDLEFFYGHLANEKGLSPTSIKHCHRLISKALNDAVRFELIQSNPASLAQTPKVIKHEGKYLNYAQLKELISLFEGHILQPFIKFMCVYGLRRSEALGLCWDKVDFDKNQFTICRACIQGDGENYVKNSTKNDSSTRTMPLIPAMKELLLELKKKREKLEKVFPSTYAENDFVFVWEDGAPIIPNYVTRTFRKIVDKSDLPKIRLHDLRHSVASNLLSSGASVVETQQWLGHSQPSTTLNFYAHTDSLSKVKTGMLIETSLKFEE